MIKKILLALLILITIFCFQTSSLVFAETENNNIWEQNREAGSAGELETANYIVSQLRSNNIEPFYEGYLQTFNFGNKQSQNVLGSIKNDLSDKYVIIGSHYDNVYKENLNSGYNDNLSGVKCNLSLASKLNSLPFNIIFAFWGAEEVGLKGSSYFIEKLDKSVKDNILLYINLDSIGAGDYLYYYHNDFNTNYGNDLDKVLFNEQVNKLGSKRLYINKTFNGLNHCHIGLQSDNASFLSAGINSLNFFAGNLNAKGFGFFETDGINKLMHNVDNKQNIENIFGEKYNINIQTVESLVVKVLNSTTILNFKPEINTIVYKDWFLKLMGGALVAVLVVVTVIFFKIKKSR